VSDAANPAQPTPEGPGLGEWAVPREVAVPRLLEQHGDRLYGLASRLCGAPEQAQDLVQETFLRAWRSWDTFEGRSDPKVWLFTIARNTCQRLHRRRSGEPQKLESLDETGPFGEPRVAVLPSDFDAFDQVVRAEQEAALQAAITTLPDEFRLPLVLKDVVGFSVAEVAAVLDLEPATVKTRVHRARLRLRDTLASGLPHEELPPPAYSRQVCLDLLRTKQESLDRGVPMPNGDQIVCERCRAVFATLDLTHDVCARMAESGMPSDLRELLASRLSA
jgi:RNA polymerase sigma-70 factor (ECF subfamily)